LHKWNCCAAKAIAKVAAAATPTPTKKKGAGILGQKLKTFTANAFKYDYERYP